MSVYALNLFDLADNDDYRAYSRQSVQAVGKHGGPLSRSASSQVRRKPATPHLAR